MVDLTGKFQRITFVCILNKELAWETWSNGSGENLVREVGMMECLHQLHYCEFSYSFSKIPALVTHIWGKHSGGYVGC
jgi:hypothetical protein